MKKGTRQKLINALWIIIYLLAIIGVIGVLKYIIYGTLY